MLVTTDRMVTARGIRDGWIRTDGAIVAELGSGPSPGRPDLDLRGRGSVIGPGFIDLHIHGAGGVDVMDGTAAGLRVMARTLAQYGVTGFLPTTYTASEETTLRALAAIDAVRVERGGSGAAVLGAHMEGPFLSIDRRGAHDPDLLRTASEGQLRAHDAAAAVRIVVLAPEIPGHIDLIRSLTSRGTLVALGHTDACAAQMIEAVEAGARVVTHLFNGMSPLHHRDPGAVGTALDLDALTCELIADGVHVSPAALRLALAAKGLDGLILVSDAGRDAGTPGATGAILNEDGVLASSLSLLDHGFRTFCAATGLDAATAWPVVSGNAARLLDLSAKGELRTGADADLTGLDGDGEVILTVIEGRVEYRR